LEEAYPLIIFNKNKYELPDLLLGGDLDFFLSSSN